jgi:hypothetical protein
MITFPTIRPVLPLCEEMFTILRPSLKLGPVLNGLSLKELKRTMCHRTASTYG